jgi:hypothetical protein
MKSWRKIVKNIENGKPSTPTVREITNDLLRPWNQKELCVCLKGQWNRIICDTQIFMVIVKASLK